MAIGTEEDDEEEDEEEEKEENLIPQIMTFRSHLRTGLLNHCSGKACQVRSALIMIVLKTSVIKTQGYQFFKGSPLHSKSMHIAA